MQEPTPRTITLPARSRPIDKRKTLAAAALCWAGFAIVVWLVTTGQSGSFDRAGLLLWRIGDDMRLGGPAFVAEMVRDVTALGGVLLRNLFALGAAAALLFLRRRREAALLFLTVTLGWAVNSGLKLLVGRERPAIVPHLMEADGASFPSGHSFNAAVVYIAIALAFATMSARGAVRYAILGTALVISALVAGSRVWLGVHFPSDAAAGWLGGAGWAFLAAALLQRPAAAAATVGR